MKKLFTLFVAIIFINQIQAQVDFAFTATSGTYQALSTGTNPTLLPTTSGGATDEGFANNINIGFNFNYLGTNYSSFGICSNGFIYLGSTGIINTNITYNNNLATELAAIRPIIAPLWDDIDVQVTNNIKYLVTGTAPNRVLTIEWANALWDPLATSAAISFQVKLYETTNIIEFIYKQEAGAIEDILGGVGASIGITTSGTGTNNFISLNNSSNSPTVSTSFATNDIMTRPATGQVYRFTPQQPCTGTPTAGTATSSVNDICSGIAFNLMLDNYTADGGINLQWQVSPTGQNTWTNLVGYNTDFITTSQTIASDYRCIVTCTNSSSSSISNVITVNLLSGSNCIINNDECTGAETLLQTAYNANCTGTAFNTSLATQSTNPSIFFGNSHDDDVWFKFVATTNKAVISFKNITTISGTLNNMAFAIYTGNNCSGFIDLGGANVPLTNGEGEVFYSQLIEGNTYYIRVATSGISWRVKGNICVAEPPITNGNINNCLSSLPVISEASNHNTWLPLINDNKIIAEINTLNNTIDTIVTNVYVSNTIRHFAGNGRPYLSRNFYINASTTPSNNIKVRLYILNTEIAALAADPLSLVNNLQDLYITSNNDACTANYSGAGTFIIPTARVSYDNGGYLEFETSTLGSFYIHGGLGILPLTIEQFAGKKINDKNILSWQTIDEINNYGFEIQRSHDGNYFSSIANVLAKENNDLNTKHHYEFIDAQPLIGNNFYRLKQINKDGRTQYSSIVLIKDNLANTPYITNVYPNPIKDLFYTQIFLPKKDNISVSIYDITGRVVLLNTFSFTEGNVIATINIAHLHKGIYTLKAIDSKGTVIGTQKLIKY